MRGKGQCDNALFDAMRKFNSNGNNGSNFNGIILLDNCNLTKTVRRNWINSVHNVRVWCVYLNLDVKTCKHRIQYRVGHPTIPPGPGGLGIIDSMVKQFEKPTVTEGFERVIELTSEADVSVLCQQWKIDCEAPAPVVVEKSESKYSWKEYAAEEEEQGGDSDGVDTPAAQQEEQGEVKLLKFPRTPHMMNLGAATRDDKVLAPSDLNLLVDKKMHLVIEEKLDGANMGISIDPLTEKIMVQNRSHYISAKYHPQFQPLDNWLLNHSAALYTVLVPGRHILYGEWLYATHSVYYNKLPDYFVAYDLYDRIEGQFYSRKKLVTLLENTNITVVPLLHVGVMHSVDALLAMVHGPSAYIQENSLGTVVNKREGCVVRVCENGRVVSRAKLVRHDFIAGNERWNKTSKLATNQLNYDL
jgi:atypical dual specificity phosphatase